MFCWKYLLLQTYFVRKYRDCDKSYLSVVLRYVFVLLLGLSTSPPPPTAKHKWQKLICNWCLPTYLTHTLTTVQLTNNFNVSPSENIRFVFSVLEHKRHGNMLVSWIKERKLVEHLSETIQERACMPLNLITYTYTVYTAQDRLLFASSRAITRVQ